jgi:hypothetical protein
MHIVHFFTIDNDSGGLNFELRVEKRATMYIVCYSCSLVEVRQRFRGPCCLLLMERRSQKVSEGGSKDL